MLMIFEVWLVYLSSVPVYVPCADTGLQGQMVTELWVWFSRESLGPAPKRDLGLEGITRNCACMT